MIKNIVVLKWNNDSKNFLVEKDTVCVEENYELYIDDKYITRISASPSNLKELGVGYAVSEGYLQPETIKKVILEDDNIIVIKKNIKCAMNSLQKNDLEYSSANTTNKSYKTYTLYLETISKIMNYMSEIKGIWEITGGTHWACLFDFKGDEIITIEDIGRHNAVDKVIGHSILNNISLANKILVSSGRTSYNMVKKVVTSNIPVLLSKSPSTDKGINLARKNNIVLIGFARKNRFTVYSG